MIEFTVYGQPEPAGSKRAVPAGGRAGGRMLIVDASKKSRPWKQEVTGAALEAMKDTSSDADGRTVWEHVHEPLEGPLIVTFGFFVSRPKGHYGKRGLRPSAPQAPITRPDLLKLARAVEDALTGVVYRDDSQIVREVLDKFYGEPERVEVQVWELTEAGPQ